MNKTLTISTLVLAFIGGFFILYNSKNPPAPYQDNVSKTGIIQSLEPKTDEQASVTVTVTPVDISQKSKEWKFNILMDTHSIELDQDIVASAVLVDDKGNAYKPISWEGAPPGGHHREGVLIWNVIKPMPKSVEMKIKDIGGIPERSFKWDLR